VPVSGSKVGKKTRPNTSAAAEPYRKKSYHSSEVPIRLARMTRRWEPAWGVVAAIAISLHRVRDVSPM
jgi:hypothetical protein